MPARSVNPLLFAFLAAMSSTPGQDPVRGARLVYEMPVDVLQRSLRDRPDVDLEQLLAETVANVKERVGDRVDVTRGDATTFVVDVPGKQRENLEKIRATIETTGKFEMRIVAHDDYLDGKTFDLAEERQRLEKWLADGNRERLRKDPAAIANFEPKSPHLRWFVQRIKRHPERPGCWNFRHTDIPTLQDTMVRAYAEEDWNTGIMPAHIRELPLEQQFLVELVAINTHETWFGNADLAKGYVKAGRSQAGGAAVNYRIVAARQREYADWSGKYVRHHSALLWQDEVMSLPVFISRIPGVGRIEIGSDADAQAMARAMQAPLLAKPKLLRIEDK